MVRNGSSSSKELNDVIHHGGTSVISSVDAHRSSCGHPPSAYGVSVDDYRRPLSRTAEPPVGAPLRPRHYVCRDRLSAMAAAALLRGVDDGGAGGWRGGAVVTFAGSSGAGKACLAAEVVGRKDVRAKFGEGVLWLQVRLHRRFIDFSSGEGYRGMERLPPPLTISAVPYTQTMRFIIRMSVPVTWLRRFWPGMSPCVVGPTLRVCVVGTSLSLRPL